jgi:hypothetical protein
METFFELGRTLWPILAMLLLCAGILIATREKKPKNKK